MTKRGWTESSIDEVINNPAKKINTIDTRFNPVTQTRLSEPATVYIEVGGSYVVRNNITGKIVQVSDKNNPNWKSPW